MTDVLNRLLKPSHHVLVEQNNDNGLRRIAVVEQDPESPTGILILLTLTLERSVPQKAVFALVAEFIGQLAELEGSDMQFASATLQVASTAMDRIFGVVPSVVDAAFIREVTETEEPAHDRHVVSWEGAWNECEYTVTARTKAGVCGEIRMHVPHHLPRVQQILAFTERLESALRHAYTTKTAEGWTFESPIDMVVSTLTADAAYTFPRESVAHEDLS